MLYSVLWSAIGLGLVAALVLRTDLQFSIEPVRNPINVVLSDGSVRNAYELRLRNMTGYDRELSISVVAPQPVDLELQNLNGLTVLVPANETLRQRVYLTSAPDSAASTTPIMDVELVVEDVNGGTREVNETIFNGRQQ
jgi:polyferredoxin